MKKLILIVGLLFIAAPVMGATPTPTVTPTVTPVSPTPSPTVTSTPIPLIIPDGVGGDIPTVLRANFTDFSTGPITDQKLTSDRTGQAFTVPDGHRLYISGISWSCLSAVIGMLEWDVAGTDVPFDYAYFPFTGQGKILTFDPPVTSLDPGISPVLTTDRGCTGWVQLNGVLR